MLATLIALLFQDFQTLVRLGANLTNEGGESLPTALYHYTGAHGLCGILRTREFWLTNFESLNDSSEMLFGLAKVTESIEAAAGSENDDRTKTGLQGIARWLATPQALFDFNPNFMAPSTAAVCSFTERGNDLAQWQAYGSGGESYAVRVRPEVLKELAQEKGIQLVRCRYDSKTFRS